MIKMEDLSESNDANNLENPSKTLPWVNLHLDEPQAVSFKVKIPVKEYPKYNFVGKLLGPKGMSLKRLQEETGTRMAILGKGSMKDRQKEEECRKEGGKYAHLNDELHVLVEVYAEVTEGYNRISHAFTELKKFLIPVNDNQDDIRQQQYQELAYMKGEAPGAPRGRGRGAGPPLPAPRGRGSVMPSIPRGGSAPRGSSAAPPLGSAPRGVPPPRGAPPSRGGHVARGRPAESYDYGRSSAPAYADSYDAPAYDDHYGRPPPREPAPYSAPPPAEREPEFYDYGHGASAADSYADPYGESAWGGSGAATMKSPPSARGRSSYSAHPYQRPSRGGY